MISSRFRIEDAGTLAGDVLLFGGPYSNLAAARALVAEAGARAIPRERRICTGDLVAYGADPVETALLVERETAWIVAGNTERRLSEDAENCGCGFEQGSACDILAGGWWPYARRAVHAGRNGTVATLPKMLGRFPDILLFRHAGRRWAVLHGGASDIARVLWPVSPEAAFAEEIALVEAEAGRIDGVVAGHSGIAFVREVAGRTWINAGAIGLPPHDGRPETRFVVLSGDGPRIERLAYDAAGARAAMEAAGLTEGYNAALTTGVWPSEDILPAALRR